MGQWRGVPLTKSKKSASAGIHKKTEPTRIGHGATTVLWPARFSCSAGGWLLRCGKRNADRGCPSLGARPGVFGHSSGVSDALGNICCGLPAPGRAGLRFALREYSRRDGMRAGSIGFGDPLLARGAAAGRKPMLLFRLSGVFLLRFAERQFAASLFQLPPRFTRAKPQARTHE